MENIQEKYKNLISAEIVKDSLNPFGNRLTTFKLVFPRYILAELNTHRLFSKNSASSRAIPFEKMVKSVTENPFIPIAWQKDHKGMQGTEYFIKEDDINGAISEWIESRDGQIANAKQLNKQGVTKQLCNRLLEPFLYHTVLLSATEFENFFELRCPKYNIELEGEKFISSFKSKKEVLDKMESRSEESYNYWKDTTDIEWLQINKGAADIHIMDLAEKMYDAYNESKPEQLKEGEYHIPFSDELATNGLTDEVKIKIATARCARLSYETLGDNPVIDYEKDIKLHDDLLAMGHMSPFEHCGKIQSDAEFYNQEKVYLVKELTDKIRKDQALGITKIIPVSGASIYNYRIVEYGWSRNFRGFQQYREIVENNKN